MSKILAGRYEILEKIGDGGMAVVYRARDKLLDRSVAIKVLRPEYVTDANFVNSFRKESRSAASLTHPNIVSIFDVGKDGNIYYIVMELIEGRPLSDIINEEGPLDYRIVMKISEQMASALSVAHKNNIIHRDVKPHNILITQDGHAKITDFGIARAVTDGTTVNDNTVKGTVHYFSPEQGRGMYMDERSDIYSLGVVMFEMLTGNVPFDADNAVAIAVMHMNDRMPRLSKLVPGVPPALEQIIMKATEKHQVNRFKNADEMLEALRNVDRLTGGFANPSIAGAVRPPMPEAQDAYAADSGYGNGYAGDGYDNVGGEYDGRDADAYDDDYDDGYVDANDGYSSSAAGTGAAYPYDYEYDEDDEDDRLARGAKNGKKPKRRDENRKYKILAVLVAIVAAGLIAYFLVFPNLEKLLNPSSNPTHAIENVVGKSEEDAKSALEALGYKVEKGEDMFSPTVAQGLVAQQDPAAGEELAEGGTVTIFLSKGQEESNYPDSGQTPTEEAVTMVQVPDLVGKNATDAENLLKAYGLALGTTTMEDSDKTVNLIIKQTPKSGNEVEKGTRVDIVISAGPKVKEAKVPNLLGLTQGKAEAALNKVNLLIRTVGEEYSDKYKKGTVMWQQYKKGQKLNEGQTVDVKISKGPEDKTNTVSITIDFAKAETDSFMLNVVLELPDGTEQQIVNNETAYKASGSKTISVTGKGTGAKVIVYFDTKIVKTYSVNFNTGKVSG
ncbi:MAG: Stk1 family PASTA domain-containing Ser/Thr kinase [Clostridiales Family XIII bacterium]|nr:Stk1 family PASTA domain-containing Ser/Thr kinase [Clostridiales Family XIII bacterium]